MTLVMGKEKVLSFCPNSWKQNYIFGKKKSRVAKITGMSHWHPTKHVIIFFGSTEV
jgi:hypothetical protein